MFQSVPTTFTLVELPLENSSWMEPTPSVPRSRVQQFLGTWPCHLTAHIWRTNSCGCQRRFHVECREEFLPDPRPTGRRLVWRFGPSYAVQSSTVALVNQRTRKIRALRMWECLTVHHGEALRGLVSPTTSVWPAHTHRCRRGDVCVIILRPFCGYGFQSFSSGSGQMLLTSLTSIHLCGHGAANRGSPVRLCVR